MRQGISLLAVLALLIAGRVLATTTPIDQTHEEEPNDTVAQSNSLNDNSGSSPCAFLQAADEDYYAFTTTVPDSVLTVEAIGSPGVVDTFLVIFDSAEASLGWDDNSGGSNGNILNARISNLTLTTPGTYYVWVVEATGGSGAGHTYTLGGQLVEPDIVDTTPPFYFGAAGVFAADHVNSTTIEVSWNQAVDDISVAAAIRYNVYYSTDPGDLFTGSPASTVVGTTNTTISGLDPSLAYFVGVRAEDEAGNVETNTIIVAVDIFLAADPGVWQRYE